MKTLVLLATLTALLLWTGQALGGAAGLLTGLVFAGLMNFGAYWWSDRLVLRMHGAREATPDDAPALHALVREVAALARVPAPRVYVIPEAAPNAFATGRSPRHAAVAVTEGLLRLLMPDELRGVIAHELAHVRNRDTLVMTVAATLGGAVSMLANVAQWGLLLGGARSSADSEEGSRDPLAGLAGVIVAPFAAMLIQMAVSRSREFVADETAARVTGDPMALAAALRKLDAWSRQTPMAAASPATAHLFIVNPFAGSGLLRLFSTHPSTDARVARLEALASRGSFERAPARDAWAQREKENRP